MKFEIRLWNSITEIDYSIILRNHITEVYYGITLRNYIVDLWYGPRLWNYMMEADYAAMLWHYIVELYYDDNNDHISTNVQRQKLSISASESFRYNTSPKRPHGHEYYGI